MIYFFKHLLLYKIIIDIYIFNILFSPINTEYCWGPVVCVFFFLLFCVNRYYRKKEKKKKTFLNKFKHHFILFFSIKYLCMSNISSNAVAV